MSMDPISIYTIGFSKKDAETFFGALQKSGIRRVVDIRLRNTSHLAGFTKRDDLRFFLKRIAGIEYEHRPDLAPSEELLTDYQKKRVDWDEYERRFRSIMIERRIECLVTPEEMNSTCLLCSEPTPDKCHRRLVVEYLQRKWGSVRITHIVRSGTGREDRRVERRYRA